VQLGVVDAESADFDDDLAVLGKPASEVRMFWDT
jgi:hypothetical protein